MTNRIRLSTRVLNSSLALSLGLGLVATPLPVLAESATSVYVSASGTNTVSVIDGDAEVIQSHIPLLGSPRELIASAAGDRIYVINAGTITAIDRLTNSSIATFAIPGLASGLALSADGNLLYAGGVNAVLIIDTLTGAVITTIAVPMTVAGLALSPEGTTAYVVGSGVLAAVDVAAGTVIATNSTLLPKGPIVTSPDGSTLYLTSDGADIFGTSGAVQVVDAATLTAQPPIWIGSFPGPLAISPEGDRLYVGIQATFVDTGYGAGFFPGSSVAILETASKTWVGGIGLGADGNNWTQQNTATGIAVAPDRSDVYVSISRISSVAVANTSTNLVRTRVPVGASPSFLTVAGQPGSNWVPYVIDAVDDINTTAVSIGGGVVATNVLANDRLGGIVASRYNVTLSQEEPLNPNLLLDTTTGRVTVAPNATPGVHSLSYRICEISSPENCDTATVTATLRPPFVIDANDDFGTGVPGGAAAINNVLANDFLGGATATLPTVTLNTVSSTDVGVSLTSGGMVVIGANTPYGVHHLVYSICEKASPTNCDSATAMISVVPRLIDAVDDITSATQSGGVVLADILTNDLFEGSAANRTRVTTTLIQSSQPGLTLNTTTGTVSLAAGTAVGTHTLRYQICESARPSNCDQANVTVNVRPYLIDAVNDSGRASSKRAGTAIASVLSNDRLGSAQATMANVILSQVSMVPNDSAIRLDLSDGSVDVLRKTSSSAINLVYRICERANPSNCDQATAIIQLSGGL